MRDRPLMGSVLLLIAFSDGCVNRLRRARDGLQEAAASVVLRVCEADGWIAAGVVFSALFMGLPLLASRVDPDVEALVWSIFRMARSSWLEGRSGSVRLLSRHERGLSILRQRFIFLICRLSHAISLRTCRRPCAASRRWWLRGRDARARPRCSGYRHLMRSMFFSRIRIYRTAFAGILALFSTACGRR